MKNLTLKKIKIDKQLQSRCELTSEVIDDYAEQVKNGCCFPPITVFFDGKTHWLADGFHRYYATSKCNKKDMGTDIIKGSRRDALLYAVGANSTHGLRRSNEDKRRAVTILLKDEEWSKWSDREIAKKCNVSNVLVSTMRKRLTVNINSKNAEVTERTYTDKHGNQSTMDVSNIGASAFDAYHNKKGKQNESREAEEPPNPLSSIEYLHGDCLDKLKELPDKSVYTCVTSPPYWGLRDYGVEGQLGLEETPEEYIGKLVEVFREVRRVLKDDGTVWLNIGDTYFQSSKTQTAQSNIHSGKHGYHYNFRHVKKHCQGLKNKDLVGIPWELALALRKDGWHLRSDIVWNKGNCMPESVKDRPTKCHEYLFMLSKNKKYYYDFEAVKEPALTESWQATYPSDGKRNKRTVWNVNPKPFKDAHFAVFPEELIVPCIKAGCPEGETVLDPFGGAGTTALVCQQLKRNCILIDINEEYVKMQKDRTRPVILVPRENLPLNRIYLGDCMDLIKDVEDHSVDLVLTDPPYGISRKNNFHTMKGYNGIDFGEWDKAVDLFSYINELSRVLKKDGSVIIFNDWRNLGNIARHCEVNDMVSKEMLRWEKRNPMPKNVDRLYVTDCEYAVWCVNKGSKWTFNRQSDYYQRPKFVHPVVAGKERTAHPTQKPEALMEDLLKVHSNPNDTVMDLFAGSGSTAVGCIEMERNYICFEKYKQFFKIADERIRHAKERKIFLKQHDSNVEVPNASRSLSKSA